MGHPILHSHFPHCLIVYFSHQSIFKQKVGGVGWGGGDKSKFGNPKNAKYLPSTIDGRDFNSIY